MKFFRSNNEGRVNAENFRLKQQLQMLQKELADARIRIPDPETLEAGERLRKGLGLDEQVVLAQFATVAESTQWWRCLMALLDTTARLETGFALERNLDDHQRHYNTGRAAAILDFRDALIQLWQRSRATNRNK